MIPWPDYLPPHLSASSLTMYHRCREQFRQRYILKHKEPPAVNLIWGTAYGTALNHNFTQKIESAKDVGISEVKEAFANSLDEECEEVGGPSEIDWGKGKSVADVKDKGVQMVGAYHTIAAPKVQPVAVEEEFFAAVKDVPVPIKGYLDAVTDDAIIEHKTAGRKWATPAGNYLIQGRIYQLHRPLPVHWHVATKTKTPGIYTPDTDPGLEEVYVEQANRWTEVWIRRTTEAILADCMVFGPHQAWPDSRALHDSPCSWCGFKKMCPAWDQNYEPPVRVVQATAEMF